MKATGYVQDRRGVLRRVLGGRLGFEFRVVRVVVGRGRNGDGEREEWEEREEVVGYRPRARYDAEPVWVD